MSTEHSRRLNAAAVARYRKTAKGRQTHRQAQQRYRQTLNGILAEVRHNTKRRGAV